MGASNSETLQERVHVVYADSIAYVVCLSCVAVAIARAEVLEPLKSLVIRRLPSGLDHWIALLMSCPMCLGFWIGVVGDFLVEVPWVGGTISRVILLPFVVSVLSAAIDRATFRRSSNNNGE